MFEKKNNTIIWEKRAKRKIIAGLRLRWHVSVSGRNNSIFFRGKTFPQLDWLKNFRIKINGNNNRIIINTPVKLNSTSIQIKGDSNYVDISKHGDCTNTIIISKNNSTIKLASNLYMKEANIKSYNNSCITIGDSTEIGDHTYIEALSGGSIEIGQNCQICRDSQLKVEDNYKKMCKIVVGDNTLIARNALIRTSDGHSILDSKTGLPTNEPKNIIIGKHCWIMAYCIILKGSVIPDGCAVAAQSLVNKIFEEKAALLLGTPAKTVRHNIAWDRCGYGELMLKREQEKKNISQDI